MIYFDNTATGGFKPREVVETAVNVIKYLSANPGRSGHRLSVTAAETVAGTRAILADFFGCQQERVVFTKNCTEALNTAIFGLAKKGMHVITTVFEHNSVLRPLYNLEREGIITLTVVAPTCYIKDEEGLSLSVFNSIKAAVRPDTKIVVMTAVSNVTGTIMPLKEVSELCKNIGAFFVVDGAQGGGHIPLNVEKLNISALAVAGHKGLYGIMGSGVLLLDEKTEINPLTYGGTGTDSFNTDQPTFYPERLEAGTLNLPAIAALGEGVRYVKHNFDAFCQRVFALTERLIKGLSEIESVNCYSVANTTGVVSFLVEGVESGFVADLLDSQFDVAVRSGLHCAPLCHKFLGTDGGGLVRVGLSAQNSTSEVDYFLRAIKKIVASIKNGNSFN